MRRPLMLLWLASTLLGWGQLDPALAPREVVGDGGAALPFGQVPEEKEQSQLDSSLVLIPTLSGLNFGASEIPNRQELDARIAPWLRKPLTEQSLDRLTDTIIAHYQENDRPVVDVFVPEQDLSKGVLLIEITEGKIGDVRMKESERFNNRLLSEGIHLQKGDEITSSGLQKQLDWLSRNPFRSASVFAAPGEEIAQADFLIAFEERSPWRTYLGYENSGTEEAGKHRFFGGLNWGNALNLDHQLGYQFTIGESLDTFHSHSISCEIPFHQQHRFLRLDAGWADVEAETVTSGSPLLAEGETWQFSLAYGIPFQRWRGATHELTIGVDYKSTDNFLNFGGSDISADRVDLLQARLAYRGVKRWADDVLSWQTVLVASPGGLTSRNDDEDFEAFRAGASADYLYAEAQVTWLHRLSQGWSTRLKVEGQVSDDELLAIEQLSFGGHDTVRGYEERGYQADSGYLISAELRTPALEVALSEIAPAKIQALGFIDHGTGWREGEGRESFTGAGAGLRVQSQMLGEARFDVAWPLDGGEGTEIHAGILLTF